MIIPAGPYLPGSVRSRNPSSIAGRGFDSRRLHHSYLIIVDALPPGSDSVAYPGMLRDVRAHAVRRRKGDVAHPARAYVGIKYP